MAQYPSRKTDPKKYEIENDPNEAIGARHRAVILRMSTTTGELRPSTTNEMYDGTVHGGSDREIKGRQRPPRPYHDTAAAGSEEMQHRTMIVERLRRAMPASTPLWTRVNATFTEEEIDAEMDAVRERQADDSDDDIDVAETGPVKKPNGGDKRPGPGDDKPGDGMGGNGKGGNGDFGGSSLIAV
ncbi:hypothetical protein B0A48_14508 [Cryoendolithus antarcticus]|uniref:Uncharacterized protein n=1 Tax=Cryoendolithus antarcticus TaxID=1507870 RepID=A0A1V8SKT4_9PEZI|nr:hypothetical protein B0A48_14508 [Cryoendolithus antarcticus]